MSLLEDAIRISVEAHRGQTDRGGKPYILHPLRVMSSVGSDDERIVAVLHDVVEDTNWTLERLSGEGFPPHILAALDGVTRRAGEDYSAFVERAALNPISIRVKLADLRDNMDISRLSVVTAKDSERLAKYHAAYKRLLAALESFNSQQPR